MQLICKADAVCPAGKVSGKAVRPVGKVSGKAARPVGKVSGKTVKSAGKVSRVSCLLCRVRSGTCRTCIKHTGRIRKIYLQKGECLS